MPEAAYIVDIVRTAGGRRKGRLSGIHPADLGAVSVNALLERTGMDPALVDDLIFGCVSQIGEQSNHLARHVVLASNLPQSVPAVTIDRQCGSSQQALHFAAQAIMSGTQDIVIAGGVEHMTRVHMGSPFRLAADAGVGEGPLSPFIQKRYDVAEFSQFTGAQMIAEKYGFDREAMDSFALQSHAKAAAAIEANAFTGEIVPVTLTEDDGSQQVHDRDEGVRFDASLETMVGLRPPCVTSWKSHASSSMGPYSTPIGGPVCAPIDSQGFASGLVPVLRRSPQLGKRRAVPGLCCHLISRLRKSGVTIFHRTRPLGDPSRFDPTAV